MTSFFTVEIYFGKISNNFRLNGSYEALNVGLVGDAMDDLTGGLTESYTLPGAEDHGLQPPSDLDDILIKSFDRRSLITARIKVC